MNKISLILAFLILSNLSVLGQVYNFRNYSVKDGVAQSQVYSILQDSRGYMWFGTRGGGISRFDGIGFKSFSSSSGLANNYVSAICEDKSGILWIASNNSISSFNGIKFINYFYKDNPKGQIFNDLTIDQSGNKWIATNYGVLLFKENEFVDVSKLIKRDKKLVNCILSARNGDIYFGSDLGLEKISSKDGKYEHTIFSKNQGLANQTVVSIQQDKNGTLWVGTYGGGVYSFDGLNFQRLEVNMELNQQSVLDIFIDKQGNLWFATLSHGVGNYNLQSKTFTWLTEVEGLANNHVRSITQDIWGNFWFGTSGGGVSNYFGKQFTNYDKTSGLGGNFIYSIYRDSRNRLWIGNSNKGLSMLDTNYFQKFDATSGFADVKVKAIGETEDGIMIFGTDGQGLFTYNNQVFRQVKGLEKKFIKAIKRADDGTIWVATSGFGIVKMTQVDSSFSYTVFRMREGITSDRLNAIHIDREGKIWYGTDNQGIGIIDNQGNPLMTITENDGLASNTIRNIVEDENGNIWVGTGGSGICRIQIVANKPLIKKIDHNHGLKSSNVYLLEFDNNHNLFVGTETGLDYLIFDEAKNLKEVKHYGKGEGFVGVETCQNSVFEDVDGIIWFGTINCLSRFNPNGKLKNEVPPKMVFSDLKLFYESISKTIYASKIGDWNQVKHIDFQYSDNHLTFEFDALNFTNPDAIQFSWMLVGFDENWSPPSTNHIVMYPNLSPETYEFRVRACNEDGVWSDPIAVKFQILKPFWLEWWFITMEILVFAGLIILVFRWRLGSVKRKAEEERMKIQLEKEVVELEQKALRLQMNPHFIFNALNSIQSLIGSNNEQQARYYLAKFSHLMRQILSNSRSQEISLDEEIKTIENYLLIEKFCNGDRFDYQIIVDKNIELDFIKIPPMLIQPFIENSIKHGFKTVDGNVNRGKIEVSFKEVGEVIECQITDNGIGRQKAAELNKVSMETYHKSTALLVTGERLDLLKQNNDIETLEFVDLIDENGNALGTKVILRIYIGN